MTTGALTRLLLLHPAAIVMFKKYPSVLLLDCTYKTNRYNMPLLNICVITGNNMVIQVGFAFLSGEKREDYNWAMDAFREVMAENSIQEPLSIVTDRELALMNCLDSRFPKSRHILCRWHVNMNVLAKTKKHFPGPIKDELGKVKRHPTFQAFLTDWIALLQSGTESDYDDRLIEMRSKYPKPAMSYCEGTWLLWKEKLVAFWVNQDLYFGVTVTSPIKGCHATLNSYLQRSNSNLKGVYHRMSLFWEAQQINIKTTIA